MREKERGWVTSRYPVDASLERRGSGRLRKGAEGEESSAFSFRPRHLERVDLHSRSSPKAIPSPYPTSCSSPSTMTQSDGEEEEERRTQRRVLFAKRNENETHAIHRPSACALLHKQPSQVLEVHRSQDQHPPPARTRAPKLDWRCIVCKDPERGCA